MRYNPGWGGKVRELRKMKGLTQQELSEKVGLHWKFIGEVERGDSDIKLGNIARIANGLEIELSELLEYCFPRTPRSEKEEEVVKLLIRLSWKKDKDKLQKMKTFIEEVLE